MWFKQLMGRLKVPLIMLAAVVAILAVPYLFVPSEVRQAVEVPTLQKVVPEAKKEAVQPPVTPSSSESKPGAKDEKPKVSNFSIRDWIPKSEPRTWLAVLLCAMGLVVVFFGKSDHRKWGAALVVAAGALLTVPSLTSEHALDGSWEATFSGFLSHIRAQTFEWGFQQWVSALLIVAGLITLALTDRKVWGAIILATAAFLLIAPPLSISSDWTSGWKDKWQELTAGIVNPLPADCNEKESDLLTLTDKDWELPLKCTMTVYVHAGKVRFQDGNKPPVDADFGGVTFPSGFTPLLIRRAESSVVTKAKFIFCPRERPDWSMSAQKCFKGERNIRVTPRGT